MTRQLTCSLTLLGALSCTSPPEPPPTIMTAAALAGFERPAADARIAYGSDALQFGELRLPDGPGPHPVAVLIHGGCWLAEYDIAHIGKLAGALADAGVATWSLEYRRVGNPGGGWPGTFLDVANGADHLRAIASEYSLDLDRIVAMGHSAGGHLALWLAARTRLPSTSPVFTPDPIPLRGVLALAPAADLAFLHEQGVCGDVVDKLMGGSPALYPHRYAQASCTELVPLGVPQVLVIGRYDAAWSPVGWRYEAAARTAGADVMALEAIESGHFEMIDPDSSTWPLVRDAAIELTGSG